MSVAPAFAEAIWLQKSALADLNEDRVLDETDVMLFIAPFAAGERGADWNMDGFVDFTDFDAFIGDFERGG